MTWVGVGVGGGGGDIFKIQRHDLDHKVTVMSADGAGKNFGPVYIMIPNLN